MTTNPTREERFLAFLFRAGVVAIIAAGIMFVLWIVNTVIFVLVAPDGTVAGIGALLIFLILVFGGGAWALIHIALENGHDPFWEDED